MLVSGLLADEQSVFIGISLKGYNKYERNETRFNLSYTFLVVFIYKQVNSQTRSLVKPKQYLLLKRTLKRVWFQCSVRYISVRESILQLFNSIKEINTRISADKHPKLRVITCNYQVWRLMMSITCRMTMSIFRVGRVKLATELNATLWTRLTSIVLE